DLGPGALRGPVLVTDPEHDGVCERERMVEHQALDLAVGAAAPMAAGKKRPADLDLAQLRLVAVVTAGADQSAGRAVDEYKTHFRIDRAVEEFPKTRLRVAVGHRMHAPDFRIGPGG